MSNKPTAIAFLNTVIAGQIRQAYDQYVASDFRHHNPYFKGDRESLLLAMEESERNMPNKTFEIQRVLEEGDTIAVHSRLILQPGQPEMATVHIFRFQDGLIVEAWDIGQQSPEKSPNENGLF